MPPVLVLVANEPRAYRETIALALRELRPEAEVLAVEPETLDAEVVRRRPDLAVCSRLSEVVETRVPAWVLLYPEGANLAVVSVRGERATSGGLGLADLATLVDRAEGFTGG